jgi:hypothetical protein
MHYDMTVSLFPSAGKMKGGDDNSFLSMILNFKILTALQHPWLP